MNQVLHEACKSATETLEMLCEAFVTKKKCMHMHGNNLPTVYKKYGFQDEDNEELYCRTCDQWFTSLHNKKEHLYGRQHLQV